MDVTVAGNTTQNITMEFGKRITTSFNLKVKDDYPDEVTKVRLTANSSKPKAASPFAFSPATGFAPSGISSEEEQPVRIIPASMATANVYMEYFFIIMRLRWLIKSFY